MDYSPQGSFIHGIIQKRILEWIAMPFSRGSSWPRSWTWVSHIAGRFFTVWTTREAGYIKNEKCQRSLLYAGQYFYALQSHCPYPSNMFYVPHGWSLWNVSSELYFPLNFGWVHPEGNTSRKNEDRKINMVVFTPATISQSMLVMTPWTVTHQASLSMEFCRQEYWSGWIAIPLLQRIFLTQESNPGLLPFRQILYQGSPAGFFFSRRVTADFGVPK